MWLIDVVATPRTAKVSKYHGNKLSLSEIAAEMMEKPYQ